MTKKATLPSPRTLKKLREARKKSNKNPTQKKVEYLTFDKRKVTIVSPKKEMKPTAAATKLSPTKQNNMLQKSMNAYRNHIDLMVESKFIDPRDPSFKNVVVDEMKDLYTTNPNMVPMHKTNWFVHDIVRNVTSKLPTNTRPVKITTKVDGYKTKRILDERRATMGMRQKKRATRPVFIAPPIKKKKKVESEPLSNSNKSSVHSGGYNMNKPNNNNNNSKTNSNNSMKSNSNKSSNNNNSAKKQPPPPPPPVGLVSPVKKKKKATRKKPTPMTTADIKSLQQSIEKLSTSILIRRRK